MIKKINLNSVDGITFEVINKVNEIIEVLNELMIKVKFPVGTTINQSSCTCFQNSTNLCPIHVMR